MSEAASSSAESFPSELPATNAPFGSKTLATLSTQRKIILASFLCLAQFLDTFANCSLFAAIPLISVQLGISNSNSVWLISGYQLTFAALLLGSGRMSDLYNPKYVFLSGTAILAGFSLGAGFLRDQVSLFILRALMGVGAALTVPSALYLIIHMFPDPVEQSRAVAMFGGFGALGGVIGLLIGALIVQWGTWPWLFFTFTILGAAVFSVIATLSPSPQHISTLAKAERFKRLDLFGVFLVTGGLILFIFGVTAGSVDGWGSARCLGPLIVSVFLIAGFFVWEAQLPEEIAAIPTSLWRVKNFTVLVVGSATLPYMWFGIVQLLFSWIWQNIYGWSPISTALHFLPIGLLASIMCCLMGPLQRNFSTKSILIFAQCIALIGTLLLTFGDSPQRYWPFVFPGLVLGTIGTAVGFYAVNVAVFAVTPPEKAGVVGSIFNCFQQVGSAAGSAIIISIQTSVDANHGGPDAFIGRKAGLWFLVGLFAISTLCLVIFMHNDIPARKKEVQDVEKELEMPEKEKVMDGLQKEDKIVRLDDAI